MSIKNGDLSAYPQDLQGRRSDNPDFAGLTKREEFAKAAMQGLLAGGYCIDDARNRLIDVPQEAVNLADVLLAELEKQP